MSVEEIILNDLLTPQIVIPIIGDGACLFRLISYNLLNDQESCHEIRNTIVVADRWNDLAHMSYDLNGDNFLNLQIMPVKFQFIQPLLVFAIWLQQVEFIQFLLNFITTKIFLRNTV